MDENELDTYQPSSPAGAFLQIMLGVIFLLLVIVGLIAGWHTFLQAAPILVQILVVLVAIAGPGAVIVKGAKAVYLDIQHARSVNIRVRMDEERLFAMEAARLRDDQRAEAEAEKMRAEAARIRAEAEKLVSTIEWDDQGNAARFDPLTRQVIQLQGRMRHYPALSSLHYSIKQDGKGDLAPALPPGGIAKPTIEEIVSHLTPNGYKICLGRSLSSGEYITADLPDAHVKLIGGTRMGKSCAAAAIIDQARRTHDRNHLLLALLDLENKTSRLFADDPHVMRIDTGYQKVKMHARTVAQVAEYLIYLHEMMVWRYTLADAQLAGQPAVLIYLEEFLYWKRVLAQQVKAETRNEALTAFTGLATRGLKAKMHLMACAQVDFRDEDLVEAMNQFIGINVAFSVKPSAAQAAGFVSSELLKQNYAARTPGQFVVEMIGGADIGVAPNFDVRAKLADLERGRDNEQVERQGQTVVAEWPGPSLPERSERQSNDSRTTGRIELDPTLQAKLAQIMEVQGENMNACIKRVWGATAGDNAKYKQAKAEYNQIQEYLHTLARLAMEGEA